MICHMFNTSTFKRIAFSLVNAFCESGGERWILLWIVLVYYRFDLRLICAVSKLASSLDQVVKVITHCVYFFNKITFNHYHYLACVLARVGLDGGTERAQEGGLAYTCITRAVQLI